MEGDDWDVHDELAAEWGAISKEEYVVDNLEDAVAQLWFMAQTVDLCDALLLAFCDVDGGREWAARSSECSRWLRWAGALREIVSERNRGELVVALKCSTELGAALDELRETVAWLIRERPGMLMAMSAWTLTFCGDKEVEDLCLEVTSRLHHLDPRVRDDRDWQFEAVVTYGFGQEDEDAG